MKKIVVAIVLIVGFSLSAQIKIGDNPTAINSGSLLELESNSKGVLFPRVALTNTSTSAPLVAHVAGMTVYNTVTVGDVTPGLYTNNGSNWVKNEGAASNLYTSDGTLAAARTVTQNNNDLTFTTGTGKTVVNGTFKTTGAVYANVRTLDISNSGAANFDLTNPSVFFNTDYILLLTKSGGQSITLPDPSGVNNGRVLYLINNSTPAGSPATYSWTGTFIPIPNTTLPTTRAYGFISNGSGWYKIIY